MEYETRKFHPEDIFPSANSETLWDSGLPKAKGFTMVDKPEQFDLPPGLPFQGGHHRYGVSWGHQYHCVVCSLFQWLHISLHLSSIYLGSVE